MDLPIVAGVECRAVVGFPGYAVGDDGSFWSCRIHGGGGGLGVKWRKNKATVAASGYVVIGMSKNGKIEQRRLHATILEAFAGPCPDGMECRHIDGNKQNNARLNLAWGTPQENADDKARHGTQWRGEQLPQAKLRAGQVVAIREAFAAGQFSTTLARKYGVTHRTILLIAKGRIWKSVGGPRTGCYHAENA